MNTLQANKLTLILVVLTSLPLLALGQFEDFRKMHTEYFDAKKWNSKAAQYHENGYTKYKYEDIGKGRKKRYEYYEDGSLLSEMEVVFKSTRDTIVSISTETYEEIVQIVENTEIVPTGTYLEYHKGLHNGKRLIHVKGEFSEGKKTGIWITTGLSGEKTKTTIKQGDKDVDHTAYKSYQSIQDEKIKPVAAKKPPRRRSKATGKFTYNNQSYSYISKDGFFGVQDDQQNEIVSPIYETIQTIYLRQGVLTLKDEKFHLFDLNTKTIIADNLENIESDYRYKFNIITKDGKKGVFDPDKRQIAVAPKYNHAQVSTKSYGSDRDVLLLYNNKGIDVYYKTKDGDAHLLKKAYQSIATFSLHRDNYALVGKDDIIELISLENLSSIFKFKNLQEIKIAPSGHVFIKSDDHWAIYKKDFTAINPGKFEDFHYLNNGNAHIEVKQNGLWGAMHRTSLDTLVIPCQYDSLSYASEKMYKICNKEGKVGLINYQREILVPMEYEDIYTHHLLQKKYWVKEDGKYHLFDGEKAGLFDQIISYFNRDLYIVQNEGMQGLYSESGKQLIIPCEYDSLYRFTYGRTSIFFRDAIALQKGDDLFLSNLKGELLSDYPFKSIIKIPTNCEIIAKDHNEKSHVIANCDSMFELPQPVDSIRQVEEGAYVIGDDGKYGFFSSGSLFEYKVTLPIVYDEVLWYLDSPADGSKLIMAKKDGKWRWVNPKTGKNNFQYVFDRIERFYDGKQTDKAKVVLDGKKKILRLDGTLEDR